MSMNSYQINDYGLVLTEYEAVTFARKYIELEHPEITDSDEWDHWELIEFFDFNIIGNFTGEAKIITEDGINNDLDSFEYYDETVIYLETKHYPNLFIKAYETYDDLINEFKKYYSKYLPEDFEYETHIRQILGTQWS